MERLECDRVGRTLRVRKQGSVDTHTHTYMRKTDRQTDTTLPVFGYPERWEETIGSPGYRWL